MKPRKPFRILRNPNASPITVYYGTREARDRAAARYAERDAATVLTELWSDGNDQGPLNRGWACDGYAQPSGHAN